MHPAAIVQSMLAAVAVRRRAALSLVRFMSLRKIYLQLGTFRMIAPLMIRDTICTASPTDLSWVVMVVEKPMSRIMTVENELTTPLGIALIVAN